MSWNIVDQGPSNATEGGNVGYERTDDPNLKVRDTNIKLEARFDKLDCFMERMLAAPFFQQHPVMKANATKPTKHPNHLMMVDPRLLSPIMQNYVPLTSPKAQWGEQMNPDVN